MDQGYTDAAKWPPHPRPMRPDAATREVRLCLRIEPRPVFFFFFFRFRIRADARRTGPIRAKSDRIGRISVCFGQKKEIGWREKKKLKTENTSGFDTLLLPSSLALTPFLTPFFFCFFAFFLFFGEPSVSVSFFLYKFCFFFWKRIVKCCSCEGLYFVFCASHVSHISLFFCFFSFFWVH